MSGLTVTLPEADWSLIPERMRPGLRSYIGTGLPPGDFLSSVLCNDLRGAFDRADGENVLIIGDYVAFLYRYAPSKCWGSEQRFYAWIKQGGLAGQSTT